MFQEEDYLLDELVDAPSRKVSSIMRWLLASARIQLPAGCSALSQLFLFLSASFGEVIKLDLREWLCAYALKHKRGRIDRRSRNGERGELKEALKI